MDDFTAHKSGGIFAKAELHVVALLQNGACGSLPFHNVQHTLEVYVQVLKVGNHVGLDPTELERVLLAALFHDVGHVSGFEGHETQSCDLAKAFLEDWDYPSEGLAVVQDCILATRMPQEPKNLMEKVLCDADLFHLGTLSFFNKNALLRKEWAQHRNMQYSDRDWTQLNITFLEGHSFFTTYGQRVLEPVKQENLAQLKDRLGWLDPF
ncbi:HD domain-containing protein [Flagellimonas zhangzhouensis]|uniref:HD domain-containing protein n=1 Tax=Flagellimonas zhangzhouensis TaxID=1073328 RepID=A0A1H2YEG9_9FLAO|nr:HD domain-containing protein [Allomuricauda zhangzhouensis]SDQ96404.1 HD domain-containing protein [Allomuricauda zhangzhouensis]SDX03603.1 HD domain-containing protein [Allomuricauda zhangzhouensis]